MATFTECFTTVFHTLPAKMDMPANVVLDIESLAQSFDKCSGSPKFTRPLSRKGSCRIDRKLVEEQDTEETSKKLVLEPLISNKPLVLVTTTSNTGLSDAVDGRTKKFNRFITVHPKEILLIFAVL
ncbi:hypothetical protein ACLOJK_041300 [Asimina triloba]